MGEKFDIPSEDWHIEITSESDSAMVLVFRNNNYSSTPFDEAKRNKIKEDIKDWGKWRVFKELKKDLNS